MLLRTIYFFIIIYIVFTAYLYFFQADQIYFPLYEITETPDQRGLAYENISLKTKDGLKLFAWFIPAKRARGTVLFCHGNAGNISHRLDSILIFHKLGLNTFIFDYRGFGQSKGKLTEEGTYLDVEAAWEFLIERGFDPEKIVIFGRSLGGAIAARLATKCKPGGLILESVFTSVPDMGHELYPYLPVRTLSRFSYNTKSYLKNIKSPVLIIHSREDEMIPFHHGEQLFAEAKKTKEFLEITGSHNEGFINSGSHYVDGLNAFLEKYL